jgi:serine/threonine protein phosphatase 1
MLSKFRKLLGAAEAAPGPAIPAGERVYAVGDIHGCAAEFAALITAIDADDGARGPAETTVILLGDLVDRGPDSARVIALAKDWQARRKVQILIGNHEEMFLDSFESVEVLRQFLRHGGRETLLSYPIDPAAYADAGFAETQRLMAAAVPAAERDWLAGLEDAVLIGDYLFVHAGIKPGVPLDQQKLSDLRWIREPFLSHRESHGSVVVHGHTISDEVEVRANRIGIDTGAFASGKLTALGLEGSARWLLQTQKRGGAVSVTQGALS